MRQRLAPSLLEFYVYTMQSFFAVAADGDRDVLTGMEDDDVVGSSNEQAEGNEG